MVLWVLRWGIIIPANACMSYSVPVNLLERLCSFDLLRLQLCRDQSSYKLKFYVWNTCIFQVHNKLTKIYNLVDFNNISTCILTNYALPKSYWYFKALRHWDKSALEISWMECFYGNGGMLWFYLCNSSYSIPKLPWCFAEECADPLWSIDFLIFWTWDFTRKITFPYQRANSFIIQLEISSHELSLVLLTHLN